jgi:DNA polymerase/3'-5' exonuclease PolX
MKSRAFQCVRKQYPDVEEELLEEIWNEAMKQNQVIIDYLAEMRKVEATAGQPFKAKAYGTAIASIKSGGVPIMSGKQAAKLKGIGAKIEKKIDEILATGHLGALERKPEELKTQSAIIDHFMTIWGIGLSKAKELYAKGYRKIEDIPMSLLNRQQQIGFKYREAFLQKIPRADITEFDTTIHELINNPEIEMVIAGSYRRGLPQSGDIDVLMRPSSISAPKINLLGIVTKMQNKNIIIDTLTLGEKVFMGVILWKGIARRLDIHVVPYSEWAPQLLYFTGSNIFNIEMHSYAMKRGYKLGEHGLTYRNTGVKIPTETEADIFTQLGVKYIPPEDRATFPY